MEHLFHLTSKTSADGNILLKLDGHYLNHVSGLVIDCAPDSVPQAYITVRALLDVDLDVVSHFRFEPDSIKEALRFLRFEIFTDDDFKEAWISSIKSALDDLEDLEQAKNHPTNTDKAGYILDRIVGDKI